MIGGGGASSAPSPAPGPGVPPARIVVTIVRDGGIIVGATFVSDGALPGVLRGLATRSKDTQLVIQADKGAAHARVLLVADEAKRAGLTKIAIAAPAP